MPNENCNQNKEVEKDYARVVEEAIRRDLDMDIPNSTFDHAFFLTTKLLEQASKEVRIFSGTLNEALYCNKINTILKSLLDRNVNIKIIVWHDAKQATISLLKSLGNLEIKLANRPKQPEYYSDVRHFLLVDNKAYRLEEPHAPQENEQPFQVKGTANFNRPLVAQVLNRTFESLWSNPRLSVA